MTEAMSQMVVHHHRPKLQGAMRYFADNTRHCSERKLHKLLYLLDFEHYRQTGCAVTGLDYVALENGPVPDASIDSPANASYDDSYFSRREQEILTRVAAMFYDDSADAVRDYSHAPGSPWQQTYGNGEGRGRRISYNLALQATPIVHGEPTIDAEELRVLDDVFCGTGLR